MHTSNGLAKTGRIGTGVALIGRRESEGGTELERIRRGFTRERSDEGIPSYYDRRHDGIVRRRLRGLRDARTAAARSRRADRRVECGAQRAALGRPAAG